MAVTGIGLVSACFVDDSESGNGVVQNGVVPLAASRMGIHMGFAPLRRMWTTYREEHTVDEAIPKELVQSCLFTICPILLVPLQTEENTTC